MKLTLVILALFSNGTLAATANPPVIYGADGRLEYFESNPVEQSWAQATLALVNKRNAKFKNAELVFDMQPYGQSERLCADEPFYQQGEVADCSGFLVAPDILVTAGHCVNSRAECKSYHFVSGFFVQYANHVPDRVRSDQVYECRELIASGLSGDKGDFAVIRLDRPVDGASPLPVRAAGEIRVGAPLVLAGYPMGLPLKIAAGASVRSVTHGQFYTNTDSYIGNSGSALINPEAGWVEGILIDGEADFVWDTKSKCQRSMQCAEDQCRGEGATKIEMILPYLNGL
ncbi:MAG: trypsin-like peptidase domain-containing protein [Bdellovibrionales bacterium]|nr:trypsin-like peptidase domain-containing protein [Bdellovibrionales bacterium]